MKETHVNGIFQPIKFGRFYLPEDCKPASLKIQAELEWIMIKYEGARALLLSKECVDWDFYNGDSTLLGPATTTTWKDSYIRKYINKTLYNDFFTKEEKRVILPVNDYNDEMFLLSLDEVMEYLPEAEQRMTEMQLASEFGGVKIDKIPKAWWTNTVGTTKTKMCVVMEDGSIVKNISNDADEIGIRPAIWVDTKAFYDLTGIDCEKLRNENSL